MCHWEPGSETCESTCDPKPITPCSQRFSEAFCNLGWGCIWETVPPPPPPSPPTGTVSLNGYSLTDDEGPFLALGATYFLALRHEKYEEGQLAANLSALSQEGFDYIRILSMVGSGPAWGGQEILPPTTTYGKDNPACNAQGDLPGWSDYWTQFRELVDRVYSYGMRTQITILADVKCVMSDLDLRRAHVSDLLTQVVAGREHKIILIEVANEYWHPTNEIPLVELREHGATIASAGPGVLLALSSPDGGKSQIEYTYEGSPVEIATVHFSRAGGWASVFDCEDVYTCGGCLPGLPMRASSNEAIGPGSSVNQEVDAVKLTMAPAVAWNSQLPMYVFHSRPGITADNKNPPPTLADPKSFLELFQVLDLTGRFPYLKSLLPADLPNWTRVLTDGSGNPFTKSAGIYRSPASVNGPEFISFPAGVSDSSQTLTARSHLTEVKICSPADMTCMNIGSVSQGATIRPRTYYDRDGFVITGKKDTPPVACFTWSCDNLLQCTFNAACSADDLGITSYSWNFGDGSAAQGSAVAHTYENPDIYQVTLTVTDTVGQQYTLTRTIDTPPVACFNWSCDGLQCTVDAGGSTDGTGAGAGITSYSWNFGDSSPPANGPVVEHTYQVGGIYQVTLTVTDTAGQQDTLTHTIDTPPLACFNWSCDGLLECTFDASCSTDGTGTGTGITAYRWDFGDGSPTVEGPDAMSVHVYEKRGTYTVSLTVVDSAGQETLSTQNVEAKDFLRTVLTILSDRRRPRE